MSFLLFPSKKKTNKTLKKQIHQYISKKGDICCEDLVDRNVIIQDIIATYKKISEKQSEPTEYLNYINNDFLVFIGIQVDLIQKKDTVGMKLWKLLDKQMFSNNQLDQMKVEKLLKEIPLYYLFAFLGYAKYTEKNG